MKKILSIASLLIAAGTANAAITVQLVGPPTSLGGGEWLWTWKASLNDGSRVENTSSSGESNGFFTIFDVGGIGFNPVLTQPAGWESSISLLGTTPQTPVPQAPADLPNVFNITWTYVGGTALVGPLDLGEFTAQSNQNISRNSFYSYRDLQNGGVNDGDAQDGSSVTRTPGGGIREEPPPIPEPATMGLMGSALAGLAFLVRRRS